MQANVTAFVTWVTGEVLKAPEPVALLALGVLFLAVSFGGRARRVRISVPKPTAPPAARRAAPQAALAPQQIH